ncbi:unnamed protein product [Ambrosiozyma monospora]|uniref:Protein phosphatase methylesterase 1 n=1 Tax=Ambrosiozyma monospora TaxID=43982 RepID=A0A9W6YQM3_AMBMO|nr:unnamed protein product [Ambrosiozyma monospora]
MSNFQKKLFQSKLRQAEQSLGFDFAEDLDEEDEEQEDELPELRVHGGVLSGSSTFSSSKKKQHTSGKTVHELPKPTQFFNQNDIYRNPETGYLFQTYYTGSPSDLNPSDSSSNPEFHPSESTDEDPDIVLFCHQGAGSSGLTFAKLAEGIQKKATTSNEHDGGISFKKTPNLFTFDMRGHGMTNTLNHIPGDKAVGTVAHGKEDENLLLGIDQLCEDFAFILTRFMQWFSRQCSGSKRKVHFYLVGHSLGGSVLTKVLYEQDKNIKKRLSDEIFQNVKGLVMIDIVEETAVKALGSMNSYLRSVPPQFASLQSAIDWHVKTGLIHNRKSAEISIPVMVTPTRVFPSC